VASSETVTILFTDMVGSTELSQRLDPKTADALRQGHFSHLRQAIAVTEGREVKNLGDGIMVVFANPSAAVACAVAMQQAVQHDNRRSATPLELRVAMSGGEVTTEDDDYFGDPVVEAARLCGICEGGQILISDAVRIMAGRRNPHPFTSLGDRKLKGLPEPVPVYAVEWEPIAMTTGVPLPDRLESTSTAALFGFYGRQNERSILAGEVKSAIEGQRRVAFLSGEPGIGKTSLCAQVAQSAYGLGVCVLYGRCDEDLGQSYQPFAEALADLIIHADEGLLDAHISTHGGALTGVVPALSTRMPNVSPVQSADPDTQRLQLFSAVVGLLALVSADAGLLLVLDDLHWADKASLQLLRHVAGSRQLSKVMVLGTYRDSELSAGNALSDTLASLRRDVNAERIDLVGLEDVEIIEMMEHVAGHKMDDDGVGLAHAVRLETNGNPFFTTEMLIHLGEAGLVHQDENGRWVASDDLYEKGLPQSVREVVGQRVDRLGEDIRPVLSQAAVIGRDFDLTLLAKVADIDEDRLLDLVDRATQAGVVTEVEGMVERFSFTHALMQHTLYEDLGATRRARVHRKIAGALEELCGDSPETRAGELARHFVAATKTADTVKALWYTKMAGEQALAQLAPADALGWFAQALDLYHLVPSDEIIHCDLLIGLGSAQRQTGDPAHRETLLHAAAIAKAIHDPDRLVRAALANSRGSVSSAGQVDAERVAALGDALDAVGESESADKALILATIASELAYSGEPEKQARPANDALAMVRRLDDPLALLRVTSIAYSMFALPHNVGDRLSDLAAAISISRTIGDPSASFRANYYRAAACLATGNRAEFDSHVDACDAIAEQIDQPYERWVASMHRSLRSLLDGDTDMAEDYANGALVIGADSQPEALTTYGAQLMAIRSVQGRLGEIVEPFAQAAVDNPGIPALRAALARTYCELDRPEEALEIIENDIADGFAQFLYYDTWMSAMTVLSDVCVQLERLDSARLLYEKLLPWHALVASVMTQTEGSVALYLAMSATALGEYADSESHFIEALGVNRRLQAPFWIARTELEWAKMLRQRAQPEDDGRAKAKLTSVVDTARQCGFGLLQARAEALLSR